MSQERIETVARCLGWPESFVTELLEHVSTDAAPSQELNDALDTIHAATQLHAAVFTLCRYIPLFVLGEYKPRLELD